MKLNPDCIRDLLFAIEDLSTANSLLTSNELAKTNFLTNYNYDEILYHLNQLYLSQYIIAPNKYKCIDGTFLVQDLSPAGHEFIANIRQDTNWNKVKSISSKIGSSTLKSMQTIAENVISSAISSAFTGTP